MKNHRTYWQYLKHHRNQFTQYSTRIIVTSLLAAILILPCHAPAAELQALADVNSTRSSDLSDGTPGGCVHLAMLLPVPATMVKSRTYPALTTQVGTVQLFHNPPLSGLQPHVFAPTYVYPHAPEYVTPQQPRLAAKDDGSWVMFSW